MAGQEKDPSYRPELPDWGAYMRVPQSGEAWIHPDDVELARRMIPSPRVLKRSRWDGEYYWLHYGDTTLRVRPTMWTSVPDVDLEVGQQVELLSRNSMNDAGIYRIADIHFAARQNRIEFFLRRDDLPLEKPFEREDLRPIAVKHELRSGFYEHEPPKSSPPDDLETLDVGDLLSEPASDDPDSRK